MVIYYNDYIPAHYRQVKENITLTQNSKALLTIGELSKATGVGIKSLKYYESIGILKPDYINPDNLYRYFSLKQAYWIEIIQMSVMFDIPLKTLRKYLDAKGNIDFRAVLSLGKKEIQHKIAELNACLSFIEHVEADMDLMDFYKDSNEQYTLSLNEKHFLVEPIKIDPSDLELKKAYQKLIAKAKHLGIDAMFWDTGKFYEYLPNGNISRFAYVQVPDPCQNSILSPAGIYYCRQDSVEQIHQAELYFPNLLNKKSHAYVFEMDIFPNNSSHLNGIKEIRVIDL